MAYFQSLRKWKNRKPRAQVLPTALILGAVLLLLGLVMVSVFTNTVKNTVRANKGTGATLAGDAVLDKSINVLVQGSNWGGEPGLILTPIPGYKADVVYTDIPNTQYVVQVDAGNLLNSPGDLAFERTITVDAYSMPAGYTPPSYQPTPWTKPGGTVPAGYSNHRTIQAVIRRGTNTPALLAGGSVNVGGHWQVFWGDVYDYYDPAGCPPPPPCTTTTTISTSNPLGPCYPAWHSLYGCINAYCSVTATGAANNKIYSNDPNMPPKPQVPLDGLRTKAKAIYYEGNLSSGESGYFYNAACTALVCQGTNSVSVGAAGAAVEANHQYSSGTPFDPSVQAFNVLKRMAQNLGHALPNGGWVGNDDLVFYVDTQDGNIILNCNNEVIGGGNGANSTNCPGATPIDFKGIAFRGTFVLQGNLQTNGPASGPAITMQPPSPAVNWCPGPTPDNPVINGFLYIGGDVTKWNGTPPIYGSIDVEGDTAGSGNGKLYFRSDFNYDLVGTGGISVEKWQEIKPSAFPTPLP